MTDIKLLKTSFNMWEIKNVPAFVMPYTFIIAMPNKLSMICPIDDSPADTISLISTRSCFVIEEENAIDTMRSTNELAEILTHANVDVNIVLVDYKAFVFVDTNKAMSTVMLLTNQGYDVRYVDTI